MGIRRLLIIGLDGATWDLIKPWIEEKKLPNIAKLVKSGVKAVLTSTIHPITAPAWTSFMTGVNPSKHGVYDFVYRRSGSYSIGIMDSRSIKVPTIFDYLSAADFRVASINMPFTFPPWPINGFMLSGLFAPVEGPQLVHPPEWWNRIIRIVPDYKVNPDYDATKENALEEYVKAQIKAIESRIRVAETLLERENWDFFAIVFTATDQIQHVFWHCLSNTQIPKGCENSLSLPNNPILQIYQQIDKSIPRLTKFLQKEAQLWIVSDHGAGPLFYFVQLNNWLQQEGFLRLKGDKSAEMQVGRLLTTLANVYKGSVPSSIRNVIRKKTWRFFTVLKERFESTLLLSSIDWKHTYAYSLGACGNIFINLKGREPQGIVSPGQEYEALREEIATRLLALKEPVLGTPIVHKVLKREEAFSGPFLDMAPDLVIIWKDYGYWGRGRFRITGKEVFEQRFTWDFSKLPLTGTHRPEGILIAYGYNVKNGVDLGKAHITDLAPTFLTLLELPVPKDMDGKVLIPVFVKEPKVFHEGSIFDGKYPYNIPPYRDEDSNVIKEHLENLGYL